MRLPRLKSTVQVVQSEHRLLVLLEGDQPDLELEGDVAQIRRLLNVLDGTRTTRDVAAVLDEPEPDAEAAIAALAEAGLIDDAAADARYLSPEQLLRYDRQLRYFADVSPLPRAEIQHRLAGASVCVLGMGGLGGTAALMLAACGVGTITGVDDDVVADSNLARQVLFTEADIGQPKVVVAAKRLRERRSDLEVRSAQLRLKSPDDVRRAIRGSDVVVAAVDWPANHIGRWVNQACFELGIPYVAMSQHPPFARIGPTYVPGVTGCYACQEAAFEGSYPGYLRLLDQTADSSPAATFAPACGLIGSLVANEVVALVTSLHEPACQGRAITLDMRDLTVSRQPVARSAGCRLCAPKRSEPRGTARTRPTARPGGISGRWRTISGSS